MTQKYYKKKLRGSPLPIIYIWPKTPNNDRESGKITMTLILVCIYFWYILVKWDSVGDEGMGIDVFQGYTLKYGESGPMSVSERFY